MKPRIALARGLVAAGLLLGGALAGASPASAGSAEVALKNFAFAPAVLTVKPGTEIVWVNEDNDVHAIKSADQPAAFQSPAMQKGDKFSFVLSKAGNYKYICLLHPQMVGTIVVK